MQSPVIRRMREDERGAALVVALLSAAVMLALGIGLLSIVDTQASQSGTERTRDRAFNLAESVLNSQAFVLGRNWPATAPVGNPSCNAASAGFADTVGTTGLTPASAVPATGSAQPGALVAAGTPLDATTRLRANINASYTDSAYAGATWQVNLCDDNAGSTVWNDTLLTNKAYDVTPNNYVWVRAQATVGGKTRVVVGLVNVRAKYPLNSKYGLVSGNTNEDVPTAVSALTGTATSLITSITNGLITTNPPVAPDAAYPVPQSGVTGVRCGLLDHVAIGKTCITGAIAALAAIPLVDTLVTQGRFEQYPSVSSTSGDSIGQLRKQAKTSPGVYMATAPGGSSVATAPSCGITGATSSSVVFIEQVGTGDQYCVVDVSGGVTYKALIIGSGRVIIRGNGATLAYNATPGSANLFTGVVYALNLQTADQTQATPQKELVRIEKGARVKGAVHADGKNSTVGIVPPDFDTTALVNGLLCPGVLCALAPTLNGLFGVLGVTGTVNALINGTCLVSLPILGCTVALPGLGLNAVLGGITSQLSTYGSAIHSDVATINALTVYGASGVAPGSFRDLVPR